VTVQQLTFLMLVLGMCILFSGLAGLIGFGIARLVKAPVNATPTTCGASVKANIRHDLRKHAMNVQLHDCDPTHYLGLNPPQPPVAGLFSTQPSATETSATRRSSGPAVASGDLWRLRVGSTGRATPHAAWVVRGHADEARHHDRTVVSFRSYPASRALVLVAQNRKRR
jgi:hypothetical protein